MQLGCEIIQIIPLQEKALEVNSIIKFFKRKLCVCKCVSFDEMIVIEN